MILREEAEWPYPSPVVVHGDGRGRQLLLECDDSLSYQALVHLTGGRTGNNKLMA